MLKNANGFTLTVKTDNAQANGFDPNEIIMDIITDNQVQWVRASLEISTGSAVFSENGENTIVFEFYDNLDALSLYIPIVSEVAETIKITATILNTMLTSTLDMKFKAPVALSLQELTDKWGDWHARQGNTTCRFTSSTNYSSQSELDNYKGQCEIKYKEIVYSNFSEEPYDSVMVSKQTMTNNTGIQQSETFTWERVLTNTFTWTITEAVKITSKLSFNVGIPVIAEAKIDESVEVSVSAAQTTTSTGTTRWSVSEPVNVPPNTAVECISVVNQNTASLDFSAIGEIVGDVAVWTEDQIDGHWLSFHRIETVFNDIVNHHLAPIYGYKVDSGVGVNVTAKGKTNGSYGISINTTYNELVPPL